MPDPATDLLKSEYDRIKSEQSQRIGFRDNMLFVHLTAVGAVGGWVLSNLNPTPPAPPSPYAVYALLAIPWVGIVLGWTYVVNDHLISRTGKYVSTILSPRAKELAGGKLKAISVMEDDKKPFEIVDVFGWEPYHKADHRRISRKVVQCFVDLATFVLPSLLALAGFLYISRWNPAPNPLTWPTADWLVAVPIFVEVVFLVILAVSIVLYADLHRTKPKPVPASPPPPAAIPPAKP